MKIKRLIAHFSITTGVIIAILVIARLSLPYILLRYVNRVLNELPEYRGHVKDVDVALIRGAYVIRDFTLKKVNGKVMQPYLSVPIADLSIEWRALFHGSLVGEIEIENSQLNIVNADSPEEEQISTKGDWQKMVKQLFPVKINRFGVEKSTINYYHKSPNGEPAVTINNLNGSLEGLSNRPVQSEVLPASAEFNAILQNTAPVKIKGKINPLSEKPTFDSELTISPIPLEKLNKFLTKTIAVDAQGGTFQLYSEAACLNGYFRGYIKPILRDVKIFSLSHDSSNPFSLVWQGVVALVTEFFTNQKHDQFATEIPFEGSLSDQHAGILSALGEIVRNAYVQALKAKIDNKIDIKSVEKKDSQ
jgi:hypothetical protein